MRKLVSENSHENVEIRESRTYWSHILLNRILECFDVRHKRVNVGGHDFNEILCHCCAVGNDALVALQWMHDAGSCVAKTEAIDAMREIQRSIVEERVDVDVAAGKVNALAASDVEIAGHFIQC